MTNIDANSLPPATSLRPKQRSTETISSSETDAFQPPSNDIGMEGLIVIAALVAFVVFGLLFRSSREVTHEKADDIEDSYRPQGARKRSASVTSLETHRRHSGIEPAPFEAKSSAHLQKTRIVQGSAFVTDGDTITINKTQIRLFGVDAPELDHPYGQKAKWAMVKLCKGQTVRAEITDTDTHGRTVARCFLPDGRDLSAEMVKLGLAIDWPKFSGGVYSSLEKPGLRKKLWLAEARQKGQMHVWEKFENSKLTRQ